MPDPLDRFIHEENIRRLSKQIEAETDPVRLKVLNALLKEEKAKQPSPAPQPNPGSKRPHSPT